MGDLRERLGSLDRVPAPDLWSEVRGREPSDIRLGPSWKRVFVALLALAVAAAGIGTAGWALLGGKTPRPVIHPAPIAPKANGLIAFVRTEGNTVASDRIWVMRPDGSAKHPIATGFDPAWSPDGSLIAFRTNFVNRWSDIAVMNADGSGQRTLVKRAPIVPFIRLGGPPTWSPDGSKLVYAAQNGLFVVPAGGGEPKLLASRTACLEYDPAWSPDGNQIVFGVGCDEAQSDAEAGIAMVNADGTGWHRIIGAGGFARSLSSPRWSPDGRRLAFDTTPGKGNDGTIYTANADGSHRSAFMVGVQPEWSPDGSRIVFVSGPRGVVNVARVDGTQRIRLASGTSPSWQPVPIRQSPPPTQSVSNGDIWFVRGGGEVGTWIESVAPDGSNRQVLFSDSYAGGPDVVGAGYDWSPDGLRLAFIDYSGFLGDNVPTGESWDIFTANADGNGRQQVTYDGGFDAAPSWSSDGAKIVYASDRGDPNRPACEEHVSCNRDIWVINADGSGQVRLTSDPGSDWQPDWSPDGSTIVFVSTRDDPAGDIYVMNADGSGVTRISDTPGIDAEPRWSPDGTQIAFVHGDGSTFTLDVMHADGTNSHVVGTGLVSSRSVEPDIFDDFSWSPDGTQTVFSGQDGKALFVVNPDGAGLRKLVEDDSYLVWAPFWRPVPGG